MSKYVQDFLPRFLEAEAEAREAMITETERQIHLAKQFCRYDKMQKLATNDIIRKVAERAKMETIRLMERL
jgi:cobalamin biosynthesis Co2+ chelatase CbiK